MHMRHFEAFLAVNAAHGYGICHQAHEPDLLAAVDAFVDPARSETFARGLDLAQFARVARDKGIFRIDQFVGDRFVAAIVHLSSQIDKFLIAGPQQFCAEIITHAVVKFSKQ